MQNPNTALPLVYDNPSKLLPLLSQILLLRSSSLSLLLHMFSLSSLLGDYWVQWCAAVWSKAGWR